MVVACLLAWPVAAGAAVRGLRLRTLLAGLAGAAILAGFTSSQSAPGGMVVGILVALAMARFPRLTGLLVRWGTVLMFLTAPFFILAVDVFMPTGTGAFWQESNAIARQLIWNETVRHILDKPWMGHGLEAGAALLSGAPHPHNGPLQLWLEMGLGGVLVITLLLMKLLGRMEKAGPRTRPFVYGGYAAFMLVFGVGYGLWYPWWMGTAGVLGLLLGAAARMESFYDRALHQPDGLPTYPRSGNRRDEPPTPG